jgi:hypothetical protein
VGAETAENSGVIAGKEPTDVTETVAALGVMANSPPGLVTSGGDALGAAAPAHVLDEDAACAADLEHKVKEVAGAERFDKGIGGRIHGIHAVHLFRLVGLGRTVWLKTSR